ncbi:hypothetical protein FRX31_019571 [Thalictrum thalictroides]|uniref:SSD domain-containing protein n=1 Tax=Thalictrum thalictroides TaxID=46969 RepID=A0A7J6W2S3_THATH|nr:hypothetical protein FRX31_019571 [Thalictrum thalictroides]
MTDKSLRKSILILASRSEFVIVIAVSVGSKGTVGTGVLVVMLSVLGSVGFFSAIGVKSTLIIMEVIPFLVLAIPTLFCRHYCYLLENVCYFWG